MNRAGGKTVDRDRIGPATRLVISRAAVRVLMESNMLSSRAIAPIEIIELQAGPLSMRFEPGSAMLRSVRLGDREVVRAVYAAVRDRNWGTVAPRLSNLVLDRAPDRFRLSFDAEAIEGPIDFRWQGTITGTPEGTVRYEMDGSARSTFLRNRVGFCALHPIRECAGEPCLVEGTDGVWRVGSFPDAIAPDQPFLDLRAVAHEVAPGMMAELRFEGDVFEMEDQRNWSDASFKTYCTPLALPFPVEVPSGTRIQQAVTLTLSGALPEVPQTRAVEEPHVEVAVLEHPGAPLPRIGLGMASHGDSPGPEALARLRAVRPSHLRLDLQPGTAEGDALLEEATRQARVLEAGLEIALFLSDHADAELLGLRAALARIRPPVVSWLVFDAGQRAATRERVTLVRRILSDYDRTVPVGGGTNAYFAELNRNRPPVEAMDLVCYSLNPQVHAFDDESLVETLEAQGATVASARRLAPDIPVAVTPITLKPRFNPNATGPEPPASPGELPVQVDARQPTLFTAAWTLASVAQLARAGAASLTFFETTGWRGIMETESGSPRPDLFPSVAGSVFPVYHVLADLGEMRDAPVIPVASSRPLAVDGLALSGNGRARVLLANLTSSPQTIQLTHPWPGARMSVRVLDAASVETAGTHPDDFRSSQAPAGRAGALISLCLGPHATACVDLSIHDD